jgi:hypothetical protein
LSKWKPLSTSGVPRWLFLNRFRFFLQVRNASFEILAGPKQEETVHPVTLRSRASLFYFFLFPFPTTHHPYSSSTLRLMPRHLISLIRTILIHMPLARRYVSFLIPWLPALIWVLGVLRVGKSPRFTSRKSNTSDDDDADNRNLCSE